MSILSRTRKWLKIQAFTMTFVIAITLPYAAEAKVVAYVTQNNNKLYQFDSYELIRSMVFSTSKPQPLYAEFLKGEPKFILDDVNGYVDYYDVIRALVFSSGNFDLDAYTSGPNAVVVEVERVNLVTVKDGKLKVTEKVIVNPVHAALEEVNAATDASTLRKLIEKHASVLGISLGNYNKLSDFGKDLVVKEVFSKKGNGFDSASKLKTTFDQQVQKLLDNPLPMVMHQVNTASDAAALRAILESQASVLGISLTNYNKLTNHGKSLVADSVLDSRGDGFADASKLKTEFDKEVQKLIDNPQPMVLHEVNSASDIAALRSILEKDHDILGLDLASYNDLSEYGKNAAVQAVLERRGDGFADADKLKTVFDEEVEKVHSSIEEPLDEINNAEDLNKLEALLLEHGEVFGLELDAYDMVISTRKGNVLNAVAEARPFTTIEQLKFEFNSALATTLKSYVIVSYTHYNRTISQMVDIQMGLGAKPQWWVSGQGWRNAPASEVRRFVDPNTFLLEDLADHVTEIIVATSTLRVRKEPTTNSSQVVSVNRGQIFSVEDVKLVLEGTSTDSIGYWFKITTGEYTGWVSGNYVDWVAESYRSPQMFQFLNLSGPSGVSVADLRLILNGRGILSGTEEAFFHAAQENNINEIFITSLALHESGNGSSTLANGQMYNGKMVYNMFGIGAHDSNPNYLGAKRAYQEGWFTPELAIIGGAKFAANNYVNHATWKQDTLYKMRWNPADPGRHQYATDINWANGQTGNIRNLYNQVNMYNLRFNIPRYVPEAE